VLDKNKQIVRRFYNEIVNQANSDVIEEIVASNFNDHSGPKTSTGIKPLKEFLTMFGGAFPEGHVDVKDLVAEDDMVAARISVTGTHKGNLLGTIPATGKQAMWSGIDIFRIQNNKIVERWNERDLLGLMQQLGVVPK